MVDCERSGRDASPTGAVVDAQAARSGGGARGQRGYDPAPRVIGHKRHLLTDTRLLLAEVSPADLHDSHGGIALLCSSRRSWPFLARCYADQACQGERIATATAVENIRPMEGRNGLAVQPRRWVVERTFA